MILWYQVVQPQGETIVRHLSMLCGLLIILAATSALAFDLGTTAPAKPAGGSNPPPPDPEVMRQGGDTMADAVLIPVPVAGITGTTVGYANDYDESCPYVGSVAPDVVYKLAPTADISVDIDMFGSQYDTKIYVYTEGLNLIACNDDWYPDYVSKLEDIALRGDTKYFLVIDGPGHAEGQYVLTITEFVSCELDCPPGADREDEPPLVDGYQDAHNGGCNSPEFGNPFGTIWWHDFCGRSGWYIGIDGSHERDTDWFELIVPAVGFIEIVGDAEYETYMFELAPQDCGMVTVVQNVIIGPCSEGTLTIPGAPYSAVWFWIGPTTYEGPVNEYNYVLDTNIWLAAVATEPHTWSAVKQLFN
jgi:hypothetical protein